MRKLIRFIFSRYFVSAMMILFSVLILFFVIFFAYSYSIYFYLLVVLITVATQIAIINKETDPEFKLPWMIIVSTIPVFGMLIYFLFYSRRLSKKEARLMKKIFEEHERSAKQVDLHIDTLRDNIDELSDIDLLALGKASSIMRDDLAAGLYQNTGSRYFPSGEELFQSMITDLKSARKYIFLEYFIVDEGELWDKVFAILKDKAREGVDVRLLYDDIGSMYTLPSNFPEKLDEYGIKCHRFGKITPKVSTVHHNRDHRKICVVDGRCAYTGGVNIADEYINAKNRFGHWKDGGVRVEGHAVAGFVKLFITVWDFTVGTVSNYDAFLSDIDKDFSGDGGYYIPFGSGPKPIYPERVGENAILTIINQAKSYVYITTPYLIIDYALSVAIKNAARRGVEVIIVTPGKEDKKKVKLMTKSFYPQLISAGVKIYEYTPGFMHEKLIISDDLYAMVGTINMDYRSFVHHFEDALWIYKSPTISAIKSEIQRTLSQSTEITKDLARLTLAQKITKDLIRIFAPLL